MPSHLDPKTYQLDIYRQAWGATRIPFAEEDSAQLYQNSDHQRIVQSLHQSATLRTTMLLSGESGSGKSALLGNWARHLEAKRWLPLVITQSTVSGTGLLSLLLEKLGGEPGLGRSKNLPRFEKALAQLGDIIPIIILDEAQQYQNDALEEMRLLQGLNLDRQRRFAMILAGDTYLLKRLRLQSHRALLNRIAISERLETLDNKQSVNYLQHHLETAELSKEVIDPEAMELISAASAGNPRVLKNLSRAAWIAASEAERTRITSEDVRTAIPRVPSAITS